jgi:hypothetical protein
VLKHQPRSLRAGSLGALALLAPLATRAQVTTVELPPVADAKVQWNSVLDWANTNYGTSTELQVGAERVIPSPEKLYRSFLRFSLASLPVEFTLERARLRLFTEIYNTIPPHVIEAYRVPDDSWSETAITWNNQPSGSGTALATTTVAALQETYWDITAAWDPTADVADDALTLMLRLADENQIGWDIDAIFDSREIGIALARPALEIRYRIGPPPPPPTTVRGHAFEKVATLDSGPQLFGITEDASGRLYLGHNSNFTGPAPVRRFDPALYSGVPLELSDAANSFGPNVGDADGITSGAGKIFVADNLGGIRQIPIANPSGSSYFAVFVSTNGGGSPLAHRPSDGHLFMSFGEVIPLVREYSAAGALLAQFSIAANAETMTLDPATGRIYYSPNGTAVRRFDPTGPTDVLVGNASGAINGGLFFDPASGLLFVGTANGANPGRVEILDPATGETRSFAAGFDPERTPGGALGIWRHSATGDLYVAQSDALYRLDSAAVFPPTPLPALPLPAVVAGALGLLGAARGSLRRQPGLRPATAQGPAPASRAVPEPARPWQSL